ncbi:MAG: glycosyltransferase [Candidatus Omnitrophota bacterium]
MKVMQILPRMDVGGVERGVYDIALYSKNKDIYSIVVSGGGRLADQLIKKGLTHYCLPVFKKSPLSILCVYKINKIIKNENIDIIHARSRVPAWISFISSRISHTDFITTAHGNYRNKVTSEVMGWGKFVICPSKQTAHHMCSKFGVPREKIILINRWVDLDKFTFTEYSLRKDCRNIVTVGRISPTKGYEYLIEAFSKTIRNHPNLVLNIVGVNPKTQSIYLNHLKSLVSRYSLNYNVNFLGLEGDINSILHNSRILVAPSVIDESFGRVIVEGFACGVPVIASRVGGFSEIISDSQDGILVEPRNPNQIYEAIEKILKNPDYANELTKRAYAKVCQKYSFEDAANKIFDVYNDTMIFKRILVIKISSLGDIILSLPSLKALKDRFPQGKIYLLTLNKYASLLDDCPYIDEIIPLDEKYKKLSNIMRTSRLLRRYGFDYIIDFQNNCQSHLISCLSFPLYSFGYSLRLGFLLTRRLPYNRQDNPLSSQEKILKLLGVTLKEKKLIFFKSPYKTSFEIPSDKVIGVNVSASARWESKNWPLNHYMTFISQLYKKFPNYHVVLLGDTHAQGTAFKIEKALRPKPQNLCGKTSLKDLADILAKLTVFITPDTAALHLACAIGTSTVAIFGPTDYNRHTVKSELLHCIQKKLPCSSCYQPVCRNNQKNACTEAITPNEVTSKVKEIISAKKTISIKND